MFHQFNPVSQIIVEEDLKKKSWKARISTQSQCFQTDGSRFVPHLD